jgi:hypothetical protein
VHLQSIQPVTPDKEGNVLVSLNDLGRSFSPPKYGYPYEGFDKIYKASLDVPHIGDRDRIRLVDGRVVRNSLAQDQFDSLFLEYWAAINQLKEQGKPFDVLVIYVPNEVEQRYNSAPQNFRASIKTKCVQLGVKTQIVSDSALNPNPYDRCERAWDLSLALYAKAGGVPWKSEVVKGNACFIGITFGIQTINSQQVTLIGLAEVFDRYGDHLDVELVQDTIPTSQFYARITEEGLYLSKEKAQKLISDAIHHGYQAHKGGSLPDHIIVHKTSPFKDEEIAGMLLAADKAEMTLIHFQRDSDLRIHQEVGGYPPRRGLFWEYETGKAGLLYTTGRSKTYQTSGTKVLESSTYFGGGSAKPVAVWRAYGETELDEIATQILGLSSMNWNSTRIANSEPITVDYARKVIPLLKAGLAPDRLPRDISYYI